LKQDYFPKPASHTVTKRIHPITIEESDPEDVEYKPPQPQKKKVKQERLPKSPKEETKRALGKNKRTYMDDEEKDDFTTFKRIKEEDEDEEDIMAQFDLGVVKKEPEFSYDFGTDMFSLFNPISF
jgi:hypothetical protein